MTRARPTAALLVTLTALCAPATALAAAGHPPELTVAPPNWLPAVTSSDSGQRHLPSTGIDLLTETGAAAALLVAGAALRGRRCPA
jgi:hypothetical protein